MTQLVLKSRSPEPKVRRSSTGRLVAGAVKAERLPENRSKTVTSWPAAAS